MGNFTLETFQLPTPQDDLSALIVEEEVPELDTARLRRAFDEAIPKLNAGRRAVFDAVVGCILPGLSSSNLEAPVSSQGAPPNAESARSSWTLLVVHQNIVTRASHDFLPLREKKVVAFATSAVAAVLLDEGRTAHLRSRYRYPLLRRTHAAFPPDLSWHGPSRYRLHYLG